MGKNIYVEVIEPFCFKENVTEIYPRTYKMWVDKETFLKLDNQNLVKIIEIKKEVYLK